MDVKIAKSPLLSWRIFVFPGANQLLWYYADLEKQRCYSDQSSDDATPTPALTGNVTVGPLPQTIEHDINHCLAWRRFAK